MKKIIIFCAIMFYETDQLTASSSSVDTSFNNTGSTTKLFVASAINQAEDIIIQHDNKIVTVGFAGDNGLIVRYNNDGTLDKTFNAQGSLPGSITLSIGNQSALAAVALQNNDGKIIVVGYTLNNNTEEALIARYNANGTLDTTFGQNGTGYISSTFRSQSRLFDVAIQTDGYILVTGWALDDNGLSNALVARYTPTGALDTTFNTTGYVITLIGGVFTQATAIQLQANGNIVITGQAQVNGNQGLCVIRYTSTGTLDTTFNSTGYTFPFSSFAASHGFDLVVQVDQKIVVVGSSSPNDVGFANQYYTILRLNNDGSLDTTFNTTGYIISDIGFIAEGVVMQSNGQIVTCGFNYTTNYIAILARYNNDGSFDETFDISSNTVASNTLASAVALQLDGKIIVAGTTNSSTF